MIVMSPLAVSSPVVRSDVRNNQPVSPSMGTDEPSTIPEHFAENVIAEHDALTPHSVLALWSTRISHLLPDSANEYADGMLGGLHAEMPSVVVAFGTSHLFVARTIESLTLFALGEWLNAH
jgi:hypothetical protein